MENVHYLDSSSLDSENCLLKELMHHYCFNGNQLGILLIFSNSNSTTCTYMYIHIYIDTVYTVMIYSVQLEGTYTVWGSLR